MKKYGIIVAMNSENNNNFIQKAFELTKDNIILAQPLIIFLIIISFTMTGLANQTNHIAYVVIFTANVLLCTAFFSGWFYMIKKAVKNANREFKNPQEKAEASLALGREFFPGVGEYFLPVSFTIVTYFVVYILLLFTSYKAGMYFLPNPELDWHKLMSMGNASVVEMQKYVASFSFEQLRAINLWMLYMLGIAGLFTFLTMFLFPAVFDRNKTGKMAGKKDFILYAPFMAFNRNIVFIFKNFFGSVGLLIFLFFVNFILSLLSILFNLNIVLTVVGLIISFYFMTYAAVLIFLYYEDKK